MIIVGRIRVSFHFIYAMIDFICNTQLCNTVIFWSFFLYLCTILMQINKQIPWFVCKSWEAGKAAAAQLVGGLRPGDPQVQHLIIFTGFYGHETKSNCNVSIRRDYPSTWYRSVGHHHTETTWQCRLQSKKSVCNNNKR